MAGGARDAGDREVAVSRRTLAGHHGRGAALRVAEVLRQLLLEDLCRERSLASPITQVKHLYKSLINKYICSILRAPRLLQQRNESVPVSESVRLSQAPLPQDRRGDAD